MLFVFPPLLVERCNMYESLLSILLSVATPCHYCFLRHALHVPVQLYEKAGIEAEEYWVQLVTPFT